MQLKGGKQKERKEQVNLMKAIYKQRGFSKLFHYLLFYKTSSVISIISFC